MSRTTRAFFNFGYVLVLAALVANGVVTTLNLRTIDESDRWIGHTREVLIELERALSTLKDAETGQRGYLLTGEAHYLEPFQDASARMDGILDRLAALTSDNPSQQGRIAELKRLKAAKMEELRQTVALRGEAGLEAALAVVRTDRGKQVMDRARQVVVAMADEEDRLLQQRTAWSRSATRWTIATFALATALVIMLLAIVFILKRREDIEQERSAEAIRRSEEWLQTTLASIGDAVIATDERGRVQFINPVAGRLTGWTQAQAAGRLLEEVFAIINEETRRQVETPVTRVLREGAVVGLANHTVLVAADGTERAIEDSAAPIKDAGGRIRGVVLVFRDATGRRAAERALRASEEHLRLIVESAQDYAIFTMDLDGTVVTWNSGARHLTGYEEAEVVGRGVEALYIPEDIERGVPEQERRKARDQGRAENERWHVRKDGSRFWASGLLMPMREGNRTVGYLKIMRDTTEEKRVEQELEVSRERLDLVVNSSEVGLWYCDLPFDKLVWNPKCKEHFGLPPDAEVTIETFYDCIHPDDREATRAAIERSIRGRTDYDVEFRTVDPQGRVRWVRSIGRAFYDLAGTPLRFDGITVDVTQRIQQEEALKEADRRKDEFLATLAHELRNPLAPIRNALHLMRGPAANGDGHEAERAMAERQVVHLARLVDDLMDVARISQGKIDLRKEVLDLAAVVGRAVESARTAIDERGHHLTVELPEGSIRLEADPTRLEQVLWNLLNNAAKYTEPGGQIRLAVESGEGEVAIRVWDTGIGIAPEMLPEVFEMFAQVDHRSARTQGGLGIGLGLVKTLVGMHGGTITAHSAGPGTGSEFVVRLPALPATSPQGAPSGQDRPGEAGTALPCRRILVVDDNADAAHSLAKVLSRLYGQEVRVAHEGHEALEAAQSFRPEVVLLDIGMPGMDGYEVARRLRDLPECEGTLLVALTGWGQEQDRVRSQDAGFDHHLVKPVDPEMLRGLLAEPSSLSRASDA